MHAFYEYNIGVNAADVLNDVVKILTGTTDKTQLSVACKQPSTSILSTVPAGWVVHDDGGAVGVSVMLASTIDISNFNGTQAQLDASVAAGRTSLNSKFMMVSVASAGYLLLRPCEYSTTARAMVNECFNANASAYGQRIYIADGGMIRINASARHCVMYACNKAMNNYGTEFTGSPTGVFERTRRAVWDVSDNGYPVSVFLAGGVDMVVSTPWNGYASQCGAGHIGSTPSFPRIRATTGGDLVGANAVGSIFGRNTTSSVENGVDGCFSSNTVPWCNDPVTTPVAGADSVQRHILRPLWPGLSKCVFPGGDISVFADFWQFTSNVGYVGDTTICNGKTYEIWASFSRAGSGVGFRYAVRMG